MKPGEFGQRFWPNKRDIAGQDKEMLRYWNPGELKLGFEHLQRVTGTPLVCLQDKLNTGSLDGRSDAVRFMADDAKDFFCGSNSLGGGDHMQKQSAAANLVKYLRALALEPRSLTRGHDGDCETG